MKVDNTIIDKVFGNLKLCYNKEQAILAEIGKIHTTEGQIRAAAGNLVEHILQNIIDTINSEIPTANIISKVGSSDYLTKKIQYKGTILTFGQIQVDRHLWQNNKRMAFIENKTYLDACYYDRALADFKKISQALAQDRIDPANMEFIVFAGQNAAKGSTLLAYEAEFWDDTKHLSQNPNGIVPKIFFFLKGKRSSAKPLYKIKHELDENSIKKFAEFIISLL